MTEQKRDIRNKPCYGCPDRYPACSDHCQKPEFLALKEKRETYRKAKRRNSELLGYTIGEIRKNQKAKR